MNRAGTRWRGKLKPPQHAHPLVRRLIEELNDQQTTMTEVAERAGLRRCAIGDWGRSYNPRVDHLEAALNVIGFELRVVERDDA